MQIKTELGAGAEAIRQIRSRLKKKLNSEAEERIEELVEKNLSGI